MRLVLGLSCMGAVAACSGTGKVHPAASHNASTGGATTTIDSGASGSSTSASLVGGRGGGTQGGRSGTGASAASGGDSGAGRGGSGGLSAAGGASGSSMGGAGGAQSSDGGTPSPDGGSADAGGATSGMCGSAICASTRCAAWSCGAATCCTLQGGLTCVHGVTQCPSSNGDPTVLQCWSGPQDAYGFAKSCAHKTDCFVAQHWMGCCNVHAVGLNTSEQSRFDSFEASCGGPPPCGCCCDRVTADDGNVVTSGTTPSVDCVAGICKSTVP